MKKLPFSVSAIEQAMATAIERKLEISEDRAFSQMTKAIVSYLNCKAMHSDKYLMNEALTAVDVFAAREAHLLKRLEESNVAAAEHTENLHLLLNQSKSEIREAAVSSKKQLLSAQELIHSQEACEKVATDLAAMPKREDLDSSILHANQELTVLSGTKASLEQKHAKRMRKLEYIVTTALELRT